MDGNDEAQGTTQHEELDDAIELVAHYANMWRLGRRAKWLAYLNVAAMRLQKCTARLIETEMPRPKRRPGQPEKQLKQYDYECDNE